MNAASPKSRPRYLMILFILIILIAASLRLHSLSKVNLWLDEGATLITAQKDVPLIFSTLYEYEINPPGYFLFMHYWIMMFGISEFSLRMPSLIFGVLSVVLVFFLARAWFDKKTGIIASLLFSISMLGVEYSQEARTYSLFAFLVLASFYYFTLMLKKHSILRFVLYIISSALLLYTHYFGAYVLLIQNLIVFACFFDRHLLKRWIGSQAIVFALFLPWLPFFIRQMAYWTVAWRSTLIGEFGLPVFLGNLGVLLMSIPVILFIIVIFAVVMLREKIYEKFVKISHIKIHQAILILTPAAYILMGFFLFPYLISPIHITKFSFFLFPFAIILVARCIGLVHYKRIRAILLGLIIISSVFSLYSYYSHTRKEEWKAAADKIYSSGDDYPVLLCVDFNLMVFRYYFDGDNEVIGMPVYSDEAANLEFFGSIYPDIAGQNFWYVKSHCRKSNNLFLSKFQESHIIEEESDLKGIEIYKFSPNES